MPYRLAWTRYCWLGPLALTLRSVVVPVIFRVVQVDASVDSAHAVQSVDCANVDLSFGLEAFHGPRFYPIVVRDGEFVLAVVEQVFESFVDACADEWQPCGRLAFVPSCESGGEAVEAVGAELRWSDLLLQASRLVGDVVFDDAADFRPLLRLRRGRWHLSWCGLVCGHDGFKVEL